MWVFHFFIAGERRIAELLEVIEESLFVECGCSIPVCGNFRFICYEVSYYMSRRYVVYASAVYASRGGSLTRSLPRPLPVSEVVSPAYFIFGRRHRSLVVLCDRTPSKS